MTALLYLMQSIQALAILHAPAGTQLRVRLTTSVASYSTRAGAPVNAILIAPAQMDGANILPAGAVLSGQVKKVMRVGLGFRHETAALELDFNRIALPGAESAPLSVRVSEVDNGRERVNKNGVIEGVRATGSISYRVSGYIKQLLLWHFHAEAAEWLIKSFVVQLPEPEIYYPAGTELTLRLTRPLTAMAAPRKEPAATAATSREDLDDLLQVIAHTPPRTIDPESGRASDLTNVLLLGSRQQIETAFESAGWTEADQDSIKSRIKCIRAAAEIHGYAAPMSPLLLNGADSDMSWQKGLNDVSKRHHIRIWKQPGLWQGQKIWIAAATRDVDLAYMRPGRAFTHQISANIDDERDKVAYDLAFTSCASPLAWTERSGLPRAARNGTGDSFYTDTRVVVLKMNDCAPRQDIDNGNHGALLTRGGKWNRFIRREILVTRSDLIRSNIYWRSYEGVRYFVEWERERRRRKLALEAYSKSSYPTLPAPPQSFPMNPVQ